MESGTIIKGKDAVKLFLLCHNLTGFGTLANSVLCGATKALLLDGILVVSPAIHQLLEDPDDEFLDSLEIEIMWSHPKATT